MNNLYIIGTLHGNLTPTEELIKEIKKINPKKILIEITEDDVKNNSMDSYPSEMISVYNWSKKEKIAIKGIDYKINVVAENVTKDDIIKAEVEQDKIISGHNWKDFNKEENNRTLNTDTWYSIINQKNLLKRQKEMLKNILNNYNAGEKTLVIVGSGHLFFLKDKLPGAIFPLS